MVRKDGKIRLWTIQPMKFYMELLKKKRVRCKPELSINLCEDKDIFEEPYQWLIHEMEKRVGPRPKGVTYPIWAWYRTNGKLHKPDLNSWMIRTIYPNEEAICIELLIDRNRVVLSDEPLWVFGPLNHLAIHEAEDYPMNQSKEEIYNTWYKIFDVDSEESDWVQATFWEIHYDDFVKAYPVRPWLMDHKSTDKMR